MKDQRAGAPTLSNLFLMRALGATRRTLACRFGITEGQVRALLAAWGEPARLQARRWRMDCSSACSEIDTVSPSKGGAR